MYYQRCVPVLGCQWCAVTCIRLGRSVCRLDLVSVYVFMMLMLSVWLNVSNYYSSKSRH